MAFLKHGFAAPAIVVLMSGSAHAALTADQIWQSWKDGAGLIGLNITAATEANSGGTLTLNGVTLAPEGAPDPLTISALTLTENSDGTVTITPGDSIGLTTGDTEDGGSVNVTHTGLTLIAREGENGGIVYDYTAEKLNIGYDFAFPSYSWDEANPLPPGKSTGSASLEGLKGTYSDTPGTNRIFGLALEASRLVYDINTVDPSFETDSKSTSDATDMKLDFSFTLPSVITLAEIDSATALGTALQQGLAFSLASSSGESRGTSSEKSQFFSFDMDMIAGPAVADVLFNKDVFKVSTSGEGGLEVNATSPDLPTPVKVTLDNMSMEILSPVQSPDVASDYGLKLKLGQLVLNDESWALFDPGAALKREPFDLALDIDGKAKVDWIEMIAADESGMAPVIPQPETLNINEAALKLAGAALDIVAALTFDNSMGFPAPLGEANVNVSGAEQLISGLIATGLIGEGEAMQVRMLMGGFMAPGSEPDSLTSKIEFKEGFSVFVNGQQVQ